MVPNCLNVVTPGATVKDTPASAGFRGWTTRQGVQDGLQRVTAGPASGTPTLTGNSGFGPQRMGLSVSLSLTHTDTHIPTHFTLK